MLCQTVMRDKLRCPFDLMQNEAESWYDSFCCGIQKSRELGCMPFKTPLFTLGLKRAESGHSYFVTIGLNGTSHLCKNTFY